MIVIGHRGAAGLAPENSMEAMRIGFEAGADMLELDVHLTKDGVPVLAHDFHTLRTHRSASIIAHCTLAQLRSRVAPGYPVVTLEEMLDEFFGLVIINIELKSRASGKAAATLVAEKFTHQPEDWRNILFSSFKPSALASVRRVSSHANLALLQHYNPFAFILQHTALGLAAVGFHQNIIPAAALKAAAKKNLFTYAYTVDQPQRALDLATKGIDGIVTNYPDRILPALYNKPARSTLL